MVPLGGRDYYFARQGTKEYDRLIAEWLARGRRAPSKSQIDKAITVIDALAA